MHYRVEYRFTFRFLTSTLPVLMTWWPQLSWWTPSPLITSCRVNAGIPLKQPTAVTMDMLQLHSVSGWYVLRTTTQTTVTRFAWHKTMEWGTTPVTGKETEFAWKASVAVTVVQVSHLHTNVLVARYCEMGIVNFDIILAILMLHLSHLKPTSISSYFNTPNHPDYTTSRQDIHIDGHCKHL